MGISKYMNHERYPRQGTHLNKKVLVCYWYDTNKTYEGTIIRDDAHEPGLTVIRLNDGSRTLLATECQYRVL